MKSTKDEAFKSVKGLSEAQLNYRVAPEKWSVKECMYHIAGGGKLLWCAFGKYHESTRQP